MKSGQTLLKTAIEAIQILVFFVLVVSGLGLFGLAAAAWLKPTLDVFSHTFEGVPGPVVTVAFAVVVFLLAVVVGKTEGVGKHLIALAVRWRSFRALLGTLCLLLSTGGLLVALCGAGVIAYHMSMFKALGCLLAAGTMLALSFFWLAFALGEASAVEAVKEFFNATPGPTKGEKVASASSTREGEEVRNSGKDRAVSSERDGGGQEEKKA